MTKHATKQDFFWLYISKCITVNLYLFILPERMQSESRDLKNPSTVHLTVSTWQVTVWLEHRFVQINHSLALTQTHL